MRDLHSVPQQTKLENETSQPRRENVYSDHKGRAERCVTLDPAIVNAKQTTSPTEKIRCERRLQTKGKEMRCLRASKRDRKAYYLSNIPSQEKVKDES